MLESKSEELIHAEELIIDGKIEEANEIIKDIEVRSDLTSEDQLKLLILKGEIHANKMQYNEAIDLGEIAYQLSQKLGKIVESIEALILKANILLLGDYNEGNKLILKAEELLESLTDQTPSKLFRLRQGIIYAKSMIYLFKGEFNEASKLRLHVLELIQNKETKYQNMYRITLLSLALMYVFIDLDVALEYGLKSFALEKKSNFQVRIAHSLGIIGVIHFYKGNLEKALEYTLKSISIKEISNTTKCMSLGILGALYMEKGDLQTSLKYLTRGAKIAEEIQNFNEAQLYMRIGNVYRMMGNSKQAISYLNRSLSIRGSFTFYKLEALLSLLQIKLEIGDLEEAERHLEELEVLADQTESNVEVQIYLLAKALVLIKKGPSRNHVEAEKLLKQIIEGEVFQAQYYILSLVSLCDYLLKELYEYNTPEILEELNLLIKRLLKIAENQNSQLHFSEAKLLGAKLALIQMNFEEAKNLLTEAQIIAESSGLTLLAQKISSEHDILLERADEWNKLKKEDAPMAERIKLASFDGVINRLQGKKAVEPPEITNEEPILLLIMDNSGSTYFNHPFVTTWDYSDLFSSFMSAFNTFSSEIFSKSIDRIRIGENTILINPIESFLACYVIKGQSYLALQKLARFTEAIRENTDIWQTLNKSVKTSEMLELNNPPSLKIVINEIFN
jgi:tetratricopeptide (TPR) repeat protein